MSEHTRKGRKCGEPWKQPVTRSLDGKAKETLADIHRTPQPYRKRSRQADIRRICGIASRQDQDRDRNQEQH